MKKYILNRISNTEKGVFGVLTDNVGIPLCCTLENPWQDNKRNVSCIPDGEYGVVKHNGAKFKDVWRLEGVKDRTAILLHAGNTSKDTRGCILVGKQFWDDGVLQSRNALGELRNKLPDSYILEVCGLSTLLERT